MVSRPCTASRGAVSGRRGRRTDSKAKTWFKTGLGWREIDAPGEAARALLAVRSGVIPLCGSGCQLRDRESGASWTVLAAEALQCRQIAKGPVRPRGCQSGRMPLPQPRPSAGWLATRRPSSVSWARARLSHQPVPQSSATAVMALPLRRNPFDTLSYALVPQNRLVLAGDLPVWGAKTKRWRR